MMLSITTGGHASAFTNKGKVGNMEDHLWSMQVFREIDGPRQAKKCLRTSAK